MYPLGSPSAAPRQALLGEPDVPEVEEGRVLEPAQLLAADREGEVVPELHPPHVLVEDGLEPLDLGLALLRVGLAEHLAQDPLLFLLAPPARPVALDGGGQRGVGAQ